MNTAPQLRSLFPHLLELPVSFRPTSNVQPLTSAFSFQSLTNCPRFATHSEPLSFQPIMNCQVRKSFVLITIQQYPGWVGVVGLLTKGLLCLKELTSPEHSLCNFFRCNTYEPLATVDSKRLTQTLNPLDATLTKNRGRGARRLQLKPDNGKLTTRSSCAILSLVSDTL